MAKDPCFNFYSDNFLSGTMFFTDEQTGKYIRLLCAQHQTGHLEEKHMIFICKGHDEDIWKKFSKDDNGLYYNERLETEINKRKAYSLSRSANKIGKLKAKKPKKTSKSYDNHMGIGIGIGIEYSFIKEEYLDIFQRWMKYKSDRKETYKSIESEIQFYKELIKLSNDNSEIALKIIEKSMANNWAGIFELKENQNGSHKQTNKVNFDGNKGGTFL
jgi:uncharacterized protein YdaU (DUF1376 family)